MGNKYSVLIVDSDVAFAAILKESLEQDGRYSTTMAASADEARQALTATEFDLVVVDMGLPDQDGGAFARDLRKQKPDLRLMLIPLMGEDLAPELADLDVQGILPKPFFFPELPNRVAAALGLGESELSESAETVAPVAETSPTQPVSSSDERLAVLRERFQEIVQEMKELSREITAEAVILTCGGKLLAHTGRLPAEEADRLAQVAGESWRASARVAQILGREQLRFEQSVEGDEYLFYSLAVAEDIILSVALRANVALGMVRHRAKSTVDELRKMIGAA
ncbi:MAG: response regulator [Chloroflexota bacterium]|nr:response regulator [Chloroflexota bacterium]